MRRGPAALALVVVCVATLAGCGSSGAPTAARTAGRTGAESHAGKAPAHPPAAGTRVQVSVARWRLPGPLSREVALAMPGGALEVAGGLTAGGYSTAAVLLVDPRTGASRPLGPLAVATHDAAGAVLRGVPVVFGGGQSGSVATVQRARGDGRWQATAALPRARSDLAAATIDGATYLVGGYDGASWDAAVLRTVDGRGFTDVASLPVPVRYAAVAAVGGTIWIFGGQARSGPTDVIQRVDPGSRRAAVVAHLQRPLTDATALVLGGAVFVCGGRIAGAATGSVTAFDPATLHQSMAGRLPVPIADAAGAVVGGTGYLLGGESTRPTSRVLVVRPVPVPGAGS